MQMHTTSRLLLPAHCDSAEVAAVKEAARLYDQFLPKGVDCLEAEFLRWMAYWTRHQRIGVRNGYWKPYPTPQY